MTEPLLSISGLVKGFGAIRATDQVDLSVYPGEIHGLIGPNGAGKTTLIRQIAGEILPDQGGIRFMGLDITRSPVHLRARAGMARTFQVTNIFPGLSVAQNLNLAVQAGLGHSFRFWTRADRLPGLKEKTGELLGLLELDHVAPRPGASLSHGEKRQLAMAMALAGNPKLLLLDEPAAGMGKDACQKLAALLSRIRSGLGILLVEHDMDLVFSLADRISVLVYGRIIATGTPEEIRNHPGVAEAYLGEGHA